MFWIIFSLLLKENLLKIEASQDFKKTFKDLRDKCLSNPKNVTHWKTNMTRCNVSFHGSCWPETLGNVTVVQTCPELFFLPTGNVSRRCDEFGIWKKTNVSSCVRRTVFSAAHHENDIYYMQRVYVGLSWLSLAVMIPSLILTIYLLKGKNERFNVHINLILAFTLRTITFFAHHYGELDMHSRITCNVFWVFNRYFAAAEITWMLNEALLLLRKVVIIFDKKSYMKYYMLVGWGSPCVLLMAVYLPTMVYVVDIAPKRCWSYHKDSIYMLVLYVPLVMVLIINFFALIYTVSVFVRRQKGPKRNELLKLKKAIKGTVMLSPLLGVIYLLIMFKPSYIPVWYQYILRILYPMQGTLACLVYLTFSGELHHKIKLKYSKTSFHERRSMLDNGSSFRTRNTVVKRSKSTSLHSVDQSCLFQSSPTCDNGLKCGCPDAAHFIPAANTGDEKQVKFLETTQDIFPVEKSQRFKTYLN